MVKYLRISALLLFVAAAMNVFYSCGEKDTEETVQLADTNWRWSDNDATGIIDLSVEFNGPKLVDVIVTDMATGVMDVKVYMGTYTCEGSNGTLSLRDDDTGASVDATFTVNGSKMTLRFKGASYTLTKEE